jgi:hypothetical protein
MTKKYNLYVGKAGQLYVMSEFLMRGWNVAMPEVDTGDDIFVVEDENDTFYRVQVKTAQANERKKGYSVQFSISLQQLEEQDSSIYFVFLIRNKLGWSNMLLIPQRRLVNFLADNQFGSVYKNNLTLYFAIEDKKVTCSKLDFTPYLNNFEDFPIVIH